MSGRLDDFAGGGAAAASLAAGAPAGGVACGAGAADTPPRMRVKSLGTCAGAGGGADRTGGGSVGSAGAGGADMGAMGATGVTAGTGMKNGAGSLDPGGGVMGDPGSGPKTGGGSVTGGTTIGTGSATGGALRARSTSVARPEFTGPGVNGSGAGSGIGGGGGGANTGIEKGDGALGAWGAAPLCDWNSRVNSPGCAAATGGAEGGACGGAGAGTGGDSIAGCTGVAAVTGSAAGAAGAVGRPAVAEPNNCVNSPGARAAGCGGWVTGRGATGDGIPGAGVGAAIGPAVGEGAGLSWPGIEGSSRGGAPRPASQLLSVAKPASSCVTTTTFPSTSTISSTRPRSGPGSRSIWSRTVSF